MSYQSIQSIPARATEDLYIRIRSAGSLGGRKGEVLRSFWCCNDLFSWQELSKCGIGGVNVLANHRFTFV